MIRPSVPVLACTTLALVLAGCVSAGSPRPAETSGAGTSSVTAAAAGESTAAAPPAIAPNALAAFAALGSPAAGALALSDDTGVPFEIGSLRGTPFLVYFGYTHCPDVCPATSGVLAQVVRAASPAPRVVFVTVDPERDTAAVLHEYLSYLPAGFVGLTGGAADIRAAADGYGVDYERVDTGAATGYTMAHTAEVTLVDGAGRVRYRFPFGTPAGTIVAAISALGG